MNKPVIATLWDGRQLRGWLTTDHPASSYGQPVFVDDDDVAHNNAEIKSVEDVPGTSSAPPLPGPEASPAELMAAGLRIIITRSPAATPQALAALRAVESRAAMASRYYRAAVEDVLRDPEVQFSPAERATIAAGLTIEQAGKTRQVPPIRVTEAEYQQIAEAAAAAGLSISAYVRRRLLGDDSAG